MANLNSQNIGLNYKGILNLNTLNGNLSGTLQAVTDGDGNASPLRLSTTSVDITSALTASGAITSLSNITCGGGSSFVINNRIIFSSFANGSLRITNDSTVGFGILQLGGLSNAFPAIARQGSTANMVICSADATANTSLGVGMSAATALNASAILQADSTTRGFLPPRMTTTQKNAISTPASGLVVYDTTLNKLAVYTGSAWETVTSL